MTTQDGPAEIDRITLRFIACLYCREQFPSVTEAKIHDTICPQHPAVQQVAVAKRFIADMFKLACEDGSIDVLDFDDEATRVGILIETRYDPAIHGEQDAEPGDPWYVIAPEWSV